MAGAQILVIYQGAIGDFVLSLPALQTIKNSFPGRAIEMLGYPGILSLVSGDVADTIRSVDWAPVSTLYGDFDEVSAQMLQYLAGFERVFVFSALENSSFIENVHRCHAAVVCIKTFPAAVQHVADYQLEQLSVLGFAPDGFIPQLFVSSADSSRADAFLKASVFDADQRLLIAVHAGSGGRHKCWPPELFVSVLHRLHEERQAEFLIVQGPADEKAAAELKPGLAGLPHVMLANFDLPLVAAIISRSALFMGNDSGITHIAAALGIPTVAVFGPTDPAVWGPRGKSVCCVRECGGDGQWRWPESDTVLQSARGLLGG